MEDTTSTTPEIYTTRCAVLRKSLALLTEHVEFLLAEFRRLQPVNASSSDIPAELSRLLNDMSNYIEKTLQSDPHVHKDRMKSIMGEVSHTIRVISSKFERLQTQLPSSHSSIADRRLYNVRINKDGQQHTITPFQLWRAVDAHAETVISTAMDDGFVCDGIAVMSHKSDWAKLVRYLGNNKTQRVLVVFNDLSIVVIAPADKEYLRDGEKQRYATALVHDPNAQVWDWNGSLSFGVDTILRYMRKPLVPDLEGHLSPLMETISSVLAHNLPPNLGRKFRFYKDNESFTKIVLGIEWNAQNVSRTIDN
ncbi:hypothetical protein HK104_001160 [Borealophlyctis nickersoniae]|nr:hypothetical protein HK104_001160 [Borealophlyctis nickersoniae]